MRQTIMRLLLFFIGIPLLAGIIIFLPQYNHLAWNIILILGSAAGANELYIMLQKRKELPIIKFPAAGAIIPAAAYLEMTFFRFPGFTEIVSTVLLGIIMVREVFTSDETKIQSVLPRTVTSLAAVIYPGLFMAYAIRISSLQGSTHLILLFLVLVFTNDSLAYVTGSLFGRKSLKPFKVSPNKSIVGFAGGTLFTVAAGILFRYFFPDILTLNTIETIVLSFAISAAANAGDLIESAFKRSAGVKDSGVLMPGRGGILDSIDSVLFSAPFYYYILKITLI